MPISVKSAGVETSLGTGTTKTQLTGGSITVPAWARKILAVRVTVYPLTPKANICYNAKFMLESEDITGLTPFIALAPPVGGGDATEISTVVPPLEEYIVNCPVSGGENLDCYMQMLTGDGTANVYGGMDLIFGSAGALLPPHRDPLRGMQRHAKVGTWTACAAAAEKAGTAYTVIGAKRIVEVLGIANSFTATASKPLAGRFRLESAGFHTTPISWQASPVGSFISTSGADADRAAFLSRVKDLDIGVDSHINIQDYFDSGVAGLATDYFVTGVVWI